MTAWVDPVEKMTSLIIDESFRFPEAFSNGGQFVHVGKHGAQRSRNKGLILLVE